MSARSRRKPINHGTIGGYRTHFRHGEPMCEPCRAAERKRKGCAGPQKRAQCGTVSGCTAHYRHGEKPCDPCRAAAARGKQEGERRRRGDAWPYELLVPKAVELRGHGLTPDQIAEQLRVSRLRVGRALARAQRGAA